VCPRPNCAARPRRPVGRPAQEHDSERAADRLGWGSS
jgi:hypothetical protein